MAENGQKVLGNEGGKECFLFDKSLKYSRISPNEYATNKENIKAERKNADKLRRERQLDNEKYHKIP